jgi:hypothetical protein
VRVPVAILMLLASQIVTADIAARVATGKAALDTAEARDYYTGILGVVIPAAMDICAPPGSKTPAEDWHLTLVGNVSAAGKIGEIEVKPANTITTCLAEQLKKTTLPAPPASIVGDKGFPLQVEMKISRTPASVALAPVAVTPVFSQLVAFSHPAGFVPALENSNDKNYVQESVPKGQSAEQWSQMVTLTGARGAASNAELTPTSFLGRMAAGLRNNCPNTFSSKPLGTLKISGYDAFIALVGCGTVQTGTPRSEVVLLVAIKGKADMYTIQWAEQAAPVAQAPVLDDTKWAPRFQLLGPIRVCDRVPGEAAPYPSCISPPAGK